MQEEKTPAVPTAKQKPGPAAKPGSLPTPSRQPKKGARKALLGQLRQLVLRMLTLITALLALGPSFRPKRQKNKPKKVASFPQYLLIQGIFLLLAGINAEERGSGMRRLYQKGLELPPHLAAQGIPSGDPSLFPTTELPHPKLPAVGYHSVKVECQDGCVECFSVGKARTCVPMNCSKDGCTGKLVFVAKELLNSTRTVLKRCGRLHTDCGTHHEEVPAFDIQLRQGVIPVNLTQMPVVKPYLPNRTYVYRVARMAESWINIGAVAFLAYVISRHFGIPTAAAFLVVMISVDINGLQCQNVYPADVGITLNGTSLNFKLGQDECLTATLDGDPLVIQAGALDISKAVALEAIYPLSWIASEHTNYTCPTFTTTGKACEVHGMVCKHTTAPVGWHDGCVFQTNGKVCSCVDVLPDPNKPYVYSWKLIEQRLGGEISLTYQGQKVAFSTWDPTITMTGFGVVKLDCEARRIASGHPFLVVIPKNLGLTGMFYNQICGIDVEPANLLNIPYLTSLTDSPHIPSDFIHWLGCTAEGCDFEYSRDLKAIIDQTFSDLTCYNGSLDLNSTGPYKGLSMPKLVDLPMEWKCLMTIDRDIKPLANPDEPLCQVGVPVTVVANTLVLSGDLHCTLLVKSATCWLARGWFTPEDSLPIPFHCNEAGSAIITPGVTQNADTLVLPESGWLASIFHYYRGAQVYVTHQAAAWDLSKFYAGAGGFLRAISTGLRSGLAIFNIGWNRIVILAGSAVLGFFLMGRVGLAAGVVLGFALVTSALVCITPGVSGTCNPWCVTTIPSNAKFTWDLTNPSSNALYLGSSVPYRVTYGFDNTTIAFKDLTAAPSVIIVYKNFFKIELDILQDGTSYYYGTLVAFKTAWISTTAAHYVPPFGGMYGTCSCNTCPSGQYCDYSTQVAYGAQCGNFACSTALYAPSVGIYNATGNACSSAPTTQATTASTTVKTTNSTTSVTASVSTTTSTATSAVQSSTTTVTPTTSSVSSNMPDTTTTDLVVTYTSTGSNQATHPLGTTQGGLNVTSHPECTFLQWMFGWCHDECGVVEYWMGECDLLRDQGCPLKGEANVTAVHCGGTGPEARCMGQVDGTNLTIFSYRGSRVLLLPPNICPSCIPLKVNGTVCGFTGWIKFVDMAGMRTEVHFMDEEDERNPDAIRSDTATTDGEASAETNTIEPQECKIENSGEVRIDITKICKKARDLFDCSAPLTCAHAHVKVADAAITCKKSFYDYWQETGAGKQCPKEATKSYLMSLTSDDVGYYVSAGSGRVLWDHVWFSSYLNPRNSIFGTSAELDLSAFNPGLTVLLLDQDSIEDKVIRASSTLESTMRLLWLVKSDSLTATGKGVVVDDPIPRLPHNHKYPRSVELEGVLTHQTFDGQYWRDVQTTPDERRIYGEHMLNVHEDLKARGMRSVAILDQTQVPYPVKEWGLVIGKITVEDVQVHGYKQSILRVRISQDKPDAVTL
jgi:hypothetical protein